MNRDKVGPLTGIGFVVVAIVSIVVMGGEPPSADDPASEIVEHYVDNKDAIMVSAFIGVLAVGLLVFFAAYLRKVLSETEGPGGFVSPIILVGGSILALALAIDATISFALAEAADEIDPNGMQTLQALWDQDFLPIALGMALFFFSAGLSIVLSGGLPKWLGWVAMVFGILGVTPLFFVGFLGGGLWILIVSVLLMRRDRTPAAGSPATGSPTTPGASGPPTG